MTRGRQNNLKTVVFHTRTTHIPRKSHEYAFTPGESERVDQDMTYTDLNEIPCLMTAQRAADYLRVSRETIYRYIRTDRLKAARVGRYHRINRTDLDLMLWDTRSAFVFQLREHTDEEIEEFMRTDELDEETAAIARAFLSQMGVSPQP